MSTKEIEVNIKQLNAYFLELQDRENLIRHIMEDIRELEKDLEKQHKITGEIRADLKAHLGIKF